MAAMTQPVRPLLRGYNLQAALMAQCPDQAIHPRFLSAHYDDLMLQQAELSHLSFDLGYTKIADMLKTYGKFNSFDVNFQDLIESKETAHNESQWAKRMQMRQKLKEHGDHLLQIHSLINLPKVNKDALTVLRNWQAHTEGGAGFLERDTEMAVWSEDAEQDLTSLSGHGQNQDPLSKFLEGKALTWLNACGLYKFKGDHITVRDRFLQLQTSTRLTVYSDHTIRGLVTVLSATLSSLLPVMSIFILFFVQRQIIRLALITVFNVLFSFVVMSTTNAKKSECFAAGAAFSAVLVVFVSGDNANKSSAN